MENLNKLVWELCKYPNETPWLEFKHNNYDPHMIGQDISALANSAALYEKSAAYMLWGIDDITHEIVGTDYNLQTLKKGNQELENWLRCMLSKNADFQYFWILDENNLFQNKRHLILHTDFRNLWVIFIAVFFFLCYNKSKHIYYFCVREFYDWKKVSEWTSESK